MAINLLQRRLAEASAPVSWALLNCTVSLVDNPEGFIGKGWRATTTVAGTVAVRPGTVLFDSAPVTPGTNYLLRVLIELTAPASRTLILQHAWYTNTGAAVATDNSITVTLVPGVPQVVAAIRVAPATAAFLTIRLNGNTFAVGDIIDYTNISVSDGVNPEYLSDFSAPDPGTVSSIATQEQYETRYGDVPAGQRGQLQAILDEVSVMAREAAGDVSLWPLGTDAPDVARVLVLKATRRELQNPAGVQSESNPEGYSYSYAGGFASATGYFTKAERDILAEVAGYSGIGSVQFVSGRSALAYAEPVAYGGDPIPWIEGQ